MVGKRRDMHSYLISGTEGYLMVRICSKWCKKKKKRKDTFIFNQDESWLKQLWSAAVWAENTHGAKQLKQILANWLNLEGTSEKIDTGDTFTECHTAGVSQGRGMHPYFITEWLLKRIITGGTDMESLRKEREREIDEHGESATVIANGQSKGRCLHFWI